MRKLIADLIAQSAAFASFLGLYFTISPSMEGRPWWHTALLVVFVIIFFYMIISIVFFYINSRPKSYTSDKKINEYMCRWVSSGGRVVILSRDMGWAGGEEVSSVLEEKARKNELTICIERDIPLTEKLKDAGARIVTYGSLGHIPRSRFTIIDFGREGARVAVGVQNSGKHTIEEFQSGHAPFFAVAEDLIQFLIGYDNEKRNV